jgi:hypothetical protein
MSTRPGFNGVEMPAPETPTPRSANPLEAERAEAQSLRPQPTRDQAKAWLDSKPPWFRAAFDEASRRDREKFSR